MVQELFGFKSEETGQLLPEVFPTIAMLVESLKISYSKCGEIKTEAYEVWLVNDFQTVLGYIVPLQLHQEPTHL